MKSEKLVSIVAVTAVMSTAVAIAQTNVAVALPGASATVSYSAQYWDVAIASLTPLIVTGIAKVAPKLPKFLLPLVTPLIGIALGLGLNWLTKINLSWVDMAKAGALAVFIREVVNQTVTKQLTSKSQPSSDTETKSEVPIL